MFVTDLELSDKQRENICLTYIEDLLLSNGRSIQDIVNFPIPDELYTMAGYNRMVYDELNYDVDELIVEHQTLYGSLTDEQKGIYGTVIERVEKDDGGMFFVYGYGGTGKTYLYKTLTAYLRSNEEIVLNVASSGIAALLLDGGRTAHSRFAIPINVVEDSMCSISVNSDLAELLRMAKLIIWDEAPMMNRFCFEAFDRTMRDVMSYANPSAEEKVFGGKVVLLGGDFRQILPVIPNGSRQDVVHSSLNASYLWRHCNVLKLTVNMRLRVGSDPAQSQEIKEFADWILDIGDGKVGGTNDGESVVKFPKDMLIPDSDDHVDAVTQHIYPNIMSNLWFPSYFQDRAILAPTHDEVDKVNKHMMSKIDGEERVYYSSDSVSDTDVDFNFDESLYTTEFLNSIRMSGVPHHELVLKVGAPIMCLRNIDQRNGLCNGTRLQVLRMGNNNIEARIISGGKIGTVCAIPRMIISPSDTKMPFKLNRRQFPVSVCFAMTINKSQGQTLSQVGLLLQRPVFSHGQLYVAVSRVKTKRGLKVICCDRDGNYTDETPNVVYKEVLYRL